MPAKVRRHGGDPLFYASFLQIADRFHRSALQGAFGGELAGRSRFVKEFARTVRGGGCPRLPG
jgi:hypothetical protein